MHELAIAEKIAKAVESAAQKNGLKKVTRVRLRLGEMAAAHKDQLEFGFNTYAKNGPLAGAVLEVEEVKVLLRCDKCSAEFADPRFEDHGFAHAVAHAPLAYLPPECPKCNSENAEVIRGKEMELVDIEGD